MRDPTSEKGAAILESAIILLLFLIILFGIFEVGRVMNVQETATNAAREGARYAVTPLPQTYTLPGDTQIQTLVGGFLQASAISGATVTIQRPTIGGTTFSRVRVDVPYQPIIGALFFASTFTIKGEALMRNETN